VAPRPDPIGQLLEDVRSMTLNAPGEGAPAEELERFTLLGRQRLTRLAALAAGPGVPRDLAGRIARAHGALSRVLARLAGADVGR
jgi:hypothetical protein